MSLMPNFHPDKHCFVYCGDEFCDCACSPHYLKMDRTLYGLNVVCDETNNTSETIAAGELIVDITYTPNTPIPYIINHIIPPIVSDEQAYDDAMAVLKENHNEDHNE